MKALSTLEPFGTSVKVVLAAVRRAAAEILSAFEPEVPRRIDPANPPRIDDLVDRYCAPRRFGANASN